MHITRISTHHPVQNDWVDMEGAGFDDVEKVYVNGQPVQTIKRTDTTLKFKAERDGAISIRDAKRNEVFFSGNGITIATPNSSSPKGGSAPSAPRNSGGKPTPNSSTASPNSSGSGGIAPIADPHQARAEEIKKDYDHRMEESRSSASTSSGLSRSFTAGLNIVGMTGNGIGAAGVVRETAEGVAGLVGEAGEAGTQIGQAILEGVLAPFGESASALSQVLTEWMRAGMIAASKGISGAGRVASGIAGMGVGAVSGLALSAANVASFGGATYRDHYRKEADKRGASLDSGKFRFKREAHYSSKAGQAEVERMAMVDKYGTKKGVTGRKTLQDLSGKELDKAINKQIGADFAATGLSGAMPKAFRDKRDKFYRTDPAGKAKINAGARPLTDEDKKKAEQKQINREEWGERWKGRGERARQVGGSLLKTAGGVVTAGFGIAALGLNMIKGVIGGFFEMVGSGFKIVSSVISSAIRGITVIARDMFNVVSELGKKGRELDARTAMGGEKATTMSMNLGDFGIDANQMSSSIVGGIINPIRDKVSGLKDFQGDSTGALIQLAKKQQDASAYEKLQMRGMMGGGRYDAVAAVASYGPERLQRLGGFQEQFKVDPKAIRETEGDLYELTSMFKIVAGRTKALFSDALAPMLKGVLTQAAEYLKSNASAIKERIQMVAGFLVKELPVAVLKFGAVALRTFGSIATFGSKALLFVAHHLPTISKVFDFIGNGVQELARRAVSIVGGIMQSMSNFAKSPLFAKIAKVFGFGSPDVGTKSDGSAMSFDENNAERVKAKQKALTPEEYDAAIKERTEAEQKAKQAENKPGVNNKGEVLSFDDNNAERIKAGKQKITKDEYNAANQPEEPSAASKGAGFFGHVGASTGASWAVRAGVRQFSPNVADVMDDDDARPVVDTVTGVGASALAVKGGAKVVGKLMAKRAAQAAIKQAVQAALTEAGVSGAAGATGTGAAGVGAGAVGAGATATGAATVGMGSSVGAALAGGGLIAVATAAGLVVAALGALAIAGNALYTGFNVFQTFLDKKAGNAAESKSQDLNQTADAKAGRTSLSATEYKKRMEKANELDQQSEYYASRKDGIIGRWRDQTDNDKKAKELADQATALRQSVKNGPNANKATAASPNGTAPAATPATSATATGAATNPADPSYRPPQPVRSNDPNALDQLGVQDGWDYRKAQQNTYGVASQFGVNINTSGYVAGGQQMLRGGSSSLLDAGNAANKAADKMDSMASGYMKQIAQNTGRTAAETEKFNRDKMKVDKAVVQKATYDVMDAFNDLYNKA